MVILKSRLSVWVASGKLTLSELENGHRHSEFSHKKMVIFNGFCMFTRG